MYSDEYEEVENIADISEKVKALKVLSKRIALECKNSPWYDFIRGLTLFYEGNEEKAYTTIEKAFLKDKNIIFCTKLVQLYANAKNQKKASEWIKKRDNLKIFEREEIDFETIEAEQAVLKKQLYTHDANPITLAAQHIQISLALKKKNKRSSLKILKRWSSSTPLLARGIGVNTGKGGGLYIKWKDRGIAIDPGINFIQNMIDNEISILDIDYVLISHDHIDHNSDLPAIMDIKYQCVSALMQMPDLLDSEKDWVNRKITYYIDPATESHFQKEIRENKSNVIVLKEGLEKGQLEFLKINEDLTLKYFATEHIKNQDTYGFVLELHDGVGSKQIGYTSDTNYFPELCDYFQDAEYIIANLSEITIADLEKKAYKINHLGYQGCFNLVTTPKIYCKYFILSEFWGGKGDIRKTIADYLQNECLKVKKIIKILPGDINLSFDLTDDFVKCSICGRYCAGTDIEVDCVDNCIKYVCNKCITSKP